MTDPAHLFLQPTNTAHRQYEALRAAFAEHVPLAEIAERFHYSYGTFRNLCSPFHKKPELPFFVADECGRVEAPPHEAAPVRQETSLSRQERSRRIAELRAQQNLSAVEIAALLTQEGHPVSDSTVMRTAGLAKLRRRGLQERLDVTTAKRAAIADHRNLDLAPRHFRTDFGFLFVHDLARI